MELGEWFLGQIVENSDNRGSYNRGSTVLYKTKITQNNKDISCA